MIILWAWIVILLESGLFALVVELAHSKDVLKSPLKILDICAGSVQYACLA